MSILKYRALLTTIEQKSLTQAAELLGYTQPGISHMISSLERELGFPLLIRTKDGVFPTQNAKILQYYMQQIVSAQDKLEEISYKIHGMEKGSLRIGSFFSSSTMWLPEIVSTFLAKHPNIDLRIFEGTYGEVTGQLVNGEIDLAIISEPAPESYDFIPLWEDPILAVMSKKNPLAQHDVVDLNDLIQYPFISPEKGADESIYQVMKAEKLTPNIKFRIKGDMATISMIGQDLGVSLIPKLAIIKIWDNIAIKPLKQYHSRTLGLCIRSVKHASPAARAFIQETQDFIQYNWTDEE